MKTKRYTTIIATTLALTGLCFAEDAKPSEVKKDTGIDAAAMKSAQESFNLPTPGEMLRAADGKIDMKKLTAALGETPQIAPDASDAMGAHLLGICLADGFVSLYAKDAAHVKANGKVLLEIAEQLGADEQVTAEGKKIGTLVTNENWADAFTSADTFRTHLLQSLVHDGDKDLATIASASGWLRGFGLAAGEIAQSYQGETSRLLRQPELATHLAERVRKLPAGVITDSAKAADSLQQIATLCTVKQDADISKESVEKITAAAKEGLSALEGTPNKK